MSTCINCVWDEFSVPLKRHAQWVYYSLAIDERIKFIDSLVYDNLRSLELYQNDLQNLKDWLKRKTINCD